MVERGWPDRFVGISPKRRKVGVVVVGGGGGEMREKNVMTSHTQKHNTNHNTHTHIHLASSSYPHSEDSLIG
jgi:hypothetical protein